MIHNYFVYQLINEKEWSLFIFYSTVECLIINLSAKNFCKGSTVLPGKTLEHHSMEISRDLTVTRSTVHSTYRTELLLQEWTKILCAQRTKSTYIINITKTYIFGMSADVICCFTVISTFCEPLFDSCTICWSMIICPTPKTENIKSPW